MVQQAIPLSPQETEAIHGRFGLLPEAVRAALLENLSPGTPEKPGELRDMTKVEVLSGGRLYIFTGQYADVPLEKLLPILKSMGFGGIELACWHFDFEKAAGPEGEAYCRELLALVEKYGMKISAISDHLASQALLDPQSPKLKGIDLAKLWDDDPARMVANVQEHMRKAALIAKRLGVTVVNGFTGRSDWGDLYDFPPGVNYADAYKIFAERMKPVLDYYQELGIKFALEVHPTEIAYDINTTRMMLKAINYHPAMCINFDPSHLVHQNIDPVDFILEFGDRIVNMHAKDTKIHDTGHQGTNGSHLPMGDQCRRWNFVSPGRGCVDFDGIARALMFVGFKGCIAVEWEDTMMNRWVGAAEACVYVSQKMLFPRSDKRFDEAFET